MKKLFSCKISYIADLSNGKKPPTTNGEIPIYGGNGIMGYTNNFNAENVIIIGRVGAYCGSVHYEKGRCWVSDNAISVYAKNNSDTKFLYYLLNRLNLNHHHIGGAQPLMTQGIINNIDTIYYPLTLQKKTSAILSSLDDKIETNRAINARLEELAAAIFKSWFIDFEPFKDGEFIEDEFGSRPKGWEIRELTDIVVENEKSKVFVGEAKSNPGEYPFYTSGAAVLSYKVWIVDGRNIFLNTGGLADVKFYIGKTAYSTDTWCIKGKTGFTDWLYLYLSSIVDEINDVYFEGSALKHLKKKKLLSKTVVLPPQNTMDLFNNAITPIMDEIMSRKLQNKSLASLRDVLLPRLMSGELTPKD